MHEVPSLKYKYSDLGPYFDEATMRLHHSKHHQAYVDKLNAALEKQLDLATWTIEKLLSDLSAVPEEIRMTVRNNGGGHLNHAFFWEILRANKNGGANQPDGAIAAELEDVFGDYDTFKKQFKEAALNRFGSGWAWLIKNKTGQLEIVTTLNQDSPLSEGLGVAILGVDVWEHAYYLKYQNRRADYLDAFFSLINWPKVNELFTTSP